MNANLVIIAAIGKNRELGYNGDLIWRVREDLEFFRAATMGHFIVMGRKTYDSMPKNLPGRRYIVISRRPIAAANVMHFTNVEDFLVFADNINETIFVVGGGMIYSQLMPYCKKMILTEIEEEFKMADTHFPNFDGRDWSIETGEAKSNNGIWYRRNVYTR